MTRTRTRKTILDVIMAVLGIFTLIFLVSPLVVVIPNGFSDGNYLQFPPPGFSLRWFDEFFNTPSWTAPALTSLRVAAATATLAAVIGMATAVALHRWNFPGKQALILMLVSPLAVPFAITGIAAYSLFTTLNMYGSELTLVVAHALIGVPYVILSTAASLSRQDPHLEMAAASLGASPWRTFREVTLPLTLPGVLGGAVLAFVISFDDVVIATFVAGAGMSTLPLRMFHAVEEELSPTVAAVSVLLVVFAAVIVVLYALTNVIGQRRRSRVGVDTGRREPE